MKPAEHARAVSAQASALAGNPADLGAWLALSEALAGAGRKDDAVRSFVALGRAASELGQVALAIACSRWLARARRKKDASALLAEVAATHCAGSTRIDRSSRPRPPAPPRPGAGEGGSAAGAPVDDVDEAVARARAAVEAAMKGAAQRAGDSLPPTPLVSVLSAAELEKLASVARLVRRGEGDVVIDVGDDAETLFWLARGAVVVSREGEELGELRSGAFFGEIALLAGTRRTARVACASDCWVLEIPSRDLEAMAERAPHLAEVLAEHARARLLANVMRTSELFKRLDEDERKLLLGRFASRVVRSGDALVEQGADNELLHVIVSGRCEVRADGEVLATLVVGDGFGESSLLRRAPADADVVAVDNTVTLSLARADFDDIAIKHPELLAEVYKLLVERERENRLIHHDASDLII